MGLVTSHSGMMIDTKGLTLACYTVATGIIWSLPYHLRLPLTYPHMARHSVACSCSACTP